MSRGLRALRSLCASHIDLVDYFEQAPNPDSRISLAAERDALGQRKLRIDWRLTALDPPSAPPPHCSARSRRASAAAASNRGPGWTVPSAHRLGTTRMADDPRLGAVDHTAACRA